MDLETRGLFATRQSQMAIDQLDRTAPIVVFIARTRGIEIQIFLSHSRRHRHAIVDAIGKRRNIG